MDKFKIQGGAPLRGELPVSGSKNAALPVLAACLLTDEPVILHRIPQVKDIGTMQSLLVHAGAKLTQNGGDVAVEAKTLDRPEAPYEVVKTMRAIMGTKGTNGIIAIYTKNAQNNTEKSDNGEVSMAKNTFIATCRGFDKPHNFMKINGNDARKTIFWKPDGKGNENELSFVSADLSSVYCIELVGILKNGNLVFA